MILVVGATGHLGLAVCRRLAARDETVRALVRSTSDPKIVDEIRGLGIDLAYGDLQDRTSLDAACRDIDSVISSASSISSRVGQLHRDRRPAGSAQPDRRRDGCRGRPLRVHHPVGQHDHRLAVERGQSAPSRRRSATAAWATRCCGRASSWSTGLSPLIEFDYPNHKATIFGAGENPITWITIDDVARSAAATVANPGGPRSGHRDRREPEVLSPNEALSVFEGVMGPFEVQYVPEAALEATLAGTDDAHTRSVTALSLDFAHGDLVDTTRMTAALPFERTTVRRYVEGLPRG